MNLELFLVGFIAALTPGPDIILVIQTTLNYNIKKGLETYGGIFTGNLLLISILLIGFASLGRNIYFQTFVSLFGGLYLMYISYEIFKNRKSEVKAHSPKVGSFYLKGLYVNLSNPKAIIFFSAILVPFLDKGSLIFNILSLLCGIVSAFLTAIFLSDILRENLLTERSATIINTISSLVFFLFSIELFFNFYEKVQIIL